MRYAKREWTAYSRMLRGDIWVSKKANKHSFPYCDCSMCGRLIGKTVYEVRSRATGEIVLCLGSECIKKLK